MDNVVLQDSNALPMWSLYTRAKDTLPHGKRLENLSWRLMNKPFKQPIMVPPTEQANQNTLDLHQTSPMDRDGQNESSSRCSSASSSRCSSRNSTRSQHQHQHVYDEETVGDGNKKDLGLLDWDSLSENQVESRGNYTTDLAKVALETPDQANEFPSLPREILHLPKVEALQNEHNMPVAFDPSFVWSNGLDSFDSYQQEPGKQEMAWITNQALPMPHDATLHANEDPLYASLTHPVMPNGFSDSVIHDMDKFLTCYSTDPHFTPSLQEVHRDTAPRISNGRGVVCSNCNTTTTPLWRRGRDGQTLCNACELYSKTHDGQSRPLKYQRNPFKRRRRRKDGSRTQESSPVFNGTPASEFDRQSSLLHPHELELPQIHLPSDYAMSMSTYQPGLPVLEVQEAPHHGTGFHPQQEAFSMIFPLD